MGEDLLNCPFCGSKANVRRMSAVKAPDGGPGYLPYCTGCGIHPTHSFFTNDEAVNWWNNRAIIGDKNKQFKVVAAETFSDCHGYSEEELG